MFPPVVREFLSKLDRSLQEKEENLEEELIEQEEQGKELLREQFADLEKSVLRILLNASHEELEPRVKSEFSKFRLMMLIR